MYFAREIFEKKFNCFNCHQRFIIPKLLPCGQTICETCLNKQLSKSSTCINCPSCFKVHEFETKTTTDSFPTQKILYEMLKLKPLKVHRGVLHNKLVKIISEIEYIIKNFQSELNNIDSKIKQHCQFLRNEITDDYQLNHIENYEQKCLNSLSAQSAQRVFIQYLFNNSLLKVENWTKTVERVDITHKDENFIYNSAIAMKKMLINCSKFYDSLIFHGELLVIEYRINLLKYDGFSFVDILNIDRLLSSSNRPSKIEYKNLVFNASFQILKSFCLSMIRLDAIIITLHVYNEISKNYEIILKSIDNDGELMNENLDNINCELVKMITCDKFVLIAVKLLNVYDGFYLKLYDFDFNLIRSVLIGFEPVSIYRSDCFIYVLSNKAPFIHVYNWYLEEIYSFGQDKQPSEAFYMPNVVQIFVRDEKVFVRDMECIKVLGLRSGEMLGLINVYMVDCLLHIDSIGRIIVIDQNNKISYVYDEDGNVLFDYDLGYIGTISSFSIIYNGHLMISDDENKVLYVV
jgi:hypothetical protein